MASLVNQMTCFHTSFITVIDANVVFISHLSNSCFSYERACAQTLQFVTVLILGDPVHVYFCDS